MRICDYDYIYYIQHIRLNNFIRLFISLIRCIHAEQQKLEYTHKIFKTVYDVSMTKLFKTLAFKYHKQKLETRFAFSSSVLGVCRNIVSFSSTLLFLLQNPFPSFPLLVRSLLLPWPISI